MQFETAVGERVYVSLDDPQENVYHIYLECEKMPKEYKIRTKESVCSEGYQLCSQCEQTQLDVLR